MCVSKTHINKKSTLNSHFGAMSNDLISTTKQNYAKYNDEQVKTIGDSAIFLYQHTQ